MRALAAEPRAASPGRRRAAARTGMRVGELCDLEADAVTVIGDDHWLRIPVGKLHNDRYVPLHPHLVELLAEYRRSDGPHTPGRLLPGEHGPLNRHAVTRWIDTIAAGPGSATSTLTVSDTPWPPRRSTAACRSKRSPPCSGTAPWT